MKVAVIYTSLSGNTKMFAEMIVSSLQLLEDFEADLYRLELGIPEVSKILEYDAIVLGTYTWGKGELPKIHKDFAYELQCKPKNVFVFGTGDTQFGEENYCNAAEKLCKYYNSVLPPGKVEQAPTDSQMHVAKEWIIKLEKQLQEIKKENEK